MNPQPDRLTTKQLAELTAGGDNYIRTKNNLVKGLALRLDLNPDAPDIIVVGTGPEIVKRARLYFESQSSVPTYVKRKGRPVKWDYCGEYRAVDLRDDDRSIEAYRKSRTRDSVSAILFLENILTPKIELRGGGFGDPETRRAVEGAAVRFVTGELERRGFQVEDRQRENRGYDLLATSGRVEMMVEVKGTSGEAPHFFMTRNERLAGQNHAEWRLAIVCSALTDPTLEILTVSDVEAAFEFDALAWECRQRGGKAANGEGPN